MPTSVWEKDKSFADSADLVGVRVCRTEHGNLHAGICYKSRGDAVTLHLGWQDFLGMNWKWSNLWAVPEIEEERAFSVGRLCRIVSERFNQEQKFPYGLIFNGTEFDQDGKILLGERASGLTCATFVLALFKSNGLDVVLEYTWPIRKEGDKVWLEQIRSFADSEHFKVLENEVESGCRRIRPNELLAACEYPIPVCFDSIEVRSVEIEGEL